MGFKYRITIVYTVIVTVLLLLFSSAIYIYSYQNHVNNFQRRLVNKVESTGIMISSGFSSKDLLQKTNQAISGILQEKSIKIFDVNKQLIFSYDDDDAEPVNNINSILATVKPGRKAFFKDGKREGLAMYYRSGKSNFIIVVAAYDEDTTLWMSKLLMILSICLAASISISLVSGFIFSAKIVAPITRITQKVYHISSEDLTERLGTGKGKSKDELLQLAATINGLLDKLQASFDTQRRFISNASHELATPLTAIISQLDVSLQKERSSDEYKKVLASVKDDVKRLALLLKSLLEIAKASGSAGGIELSSVRIDEILTGLPAEMKRISPLYEVRLAFDDFPDTESSFSVYGNEALLYSAMRNIVHNACKFSRTKIAYVYLGFTDRHITISVQDDGPGIAPEDYDMIFQPFFRGYKQDNMIYGTGLGLALTNRIISLHKGSILVDTELGKGSTFRVILPMESAD